MKVSQELITEILKLNKKEWGNVKVAVDRLFDIEQRRREVDIYLNEEALGNLKYSPVPIEIER